ncbi:MAG: AbrB/MazE/SpoVT family DNA-binding domain-containing protein [Nitrospira sp.]
MEIPPENSTWHTFVDKSGRVLLPAPLRRALNADPGTELVWTMSRDGVKLQHFDQVLTSIQEYFTSLGPQEEVWSDELIRERREEAERE